MNFKTLKILLKEWLVNSTFIGLAKLIKSKHIILTVFWVFFNVVSTSICVLFLSETFQNYFSYPVVTNIETAYEQPTEFPTLLICSTDFIGKNFADLVTKCKFGTVTLDPNNYFERVSLYQGICYKFNSGINIYNQTTSILKSTIGGYDDSLKLKFYAPNNTLITIINRKDIPLIGLEIFYAPNVFELTNGFKTGIVIDKTIEKKLEQPYNDCFKDINRFDKNKTIINFYNSNNIEYSQVDCYNYCFELIYINSNPCNCSNLALGSVWIQCYKFQQNEKISNCTRDYRNRFYLDSLSDVCSNYCPSKCDSLNYYGFSDSIPISENYSEIQVYLRSLKYTLITQQAKVVISDLIANIGGTISLFIGLSFISVFELLELILNLIPTQKRIRNTIDVNVK